MEINLKAVSRWEFKYQLNFFHLLYNFMTSMRNLNIQFHPTSIFKASSGGPDRLQKFKKFKINFLSFFLCSDSGWIDTYDLQGKVVQFWTRIQIMFIFKLSVLFVSWRYCDLRHSYLRYLTWCQSFLWIVLVIHCPPYFLKLFYFFLTHQLKEMPSSSDSGKSVPLQKEPNLSPSLQYITPSKCMKGYFVGYKCCLHFGVKL